MLSQRRNSAGPGNTIRGNVMMVYRLHASKGASTLRATDNQVLNNKKLMLYQDIKVIFSFHPLAKFEIYPDLF